jgi:UDP-N-acetylglucosamine/UDP-N-acetyl-alpha-D-glucosaminouronate 4-epimerase
MSDSDNIFHNNDISQKAFLITGGAGFIGSNIVGYLLHHGAGKVRVLDNLSNGFRRNIDPFINHPAFEFIEGDITNPEVCKKACEGINYISHQAALGSVPRSIEFPLNTHASNATGFLNMLVAARDAKVNCFVYASSSSVYGDLADSPKVESSIGKALSPYAVSKYTNELYAGVFSLNYGMNIIGLRYFNVFGPSQDPNGPYAAAIPLFMDAVLNNKTAFINGDGDQTRDFTYVENAVQANIKAMLSSDSDAFGRVYNVAVGENITINKLFHMIREIAGSDLKPTHRDDRPGDIRNSLADTSLAKKYLHYRPGVKLQDGLAITFEWFKKTFSMQNN